jgi:glycosyltransferase involved in cell wall biosynthesis
MRILIVNNLYPPHSRGGAETAVENEARYLKENGHEVAVFTTAPFTGLRSLGVSVWAEEGIKVFRFFPLNIFWYKNDGKHGFVVRALWYFLNFWGWQQYFAFKKVVKNFAPDAVHLHNINGISYRLPRWSDRLGLKTVFTVHAVHYFEPSGVLWRGKKPRFLAAVFAFFTRGLINSKATVTAPSQWLLDFYTGRGFFKGQKTAVVKNPLSPDVTKVGDEEFPLPETTASAVFRFLYVGQLESYKGVNTMLAAFSSVPDTFPWRLDLIGSGALYPFLRRARDKRISLRGRLPAEDVYRAYRSASMLVVPSLCEENSPMVIAEAQRFGLPAIAAASGGIPEMIEHNKNGILVASGNADELAMQIRRVLECPEILPEMRLAAKKSAALYAPQTVGAEYFKLLSEK